MLRRLEIHWRHGKPQRVLTTLQQHIGEVKHRTIRCKSYRQNKRETRALRIVLENYRSLLPHEPPDRFATHRRYFLLAAPL